MRLTHPNHVWAIDFVHYKLSNGRTHKILTVLDEFTRQALAVLVRTKMGANDVIEAPYPLLMHHGSPEYIRSDNGSEFAAKAMQDWLRRVDIKPIRIYPGSPWENGYAKRFSGTLLREVLNAERLPPPSRHRSPSTIGSGSTITPVRISLSTCVHPFLKRY